MKHPDSHHGQFDETNELRRTLLKGMSLTVVAISFFLLGFMLIRRLVFEDMFLGDIFLVSLIIQGVALFTGISGLIFPNTLMSDDFHIVAKAIALTQMGILCLIEALSLICIGLIYATPVVSL
jgi:hypothetical protein